MKKSLFFFVATVALVAACEKESTINESPLTDPEEGLVTYSFSVSQEALDDASVKATIANDGTFAWQSTDKIAIYNTVDSKYYVFASEGSGPTVTFSRNAEAGANFTVAYYPASIVMSSEEISAGVSASAVGSTTTITLPNTYSTVDAAAAGFPMVGSVNGAGELSMAHLGGMLRFSFTNVPYQATKLVVSAGTGISGAFTVASSKITATGTGTVTISFSKGAFDGTEAVFSVPVPTGDYSSITVSLQDSNSASIFEKTKSSSTTVARKKLWKVASVDALGEEFYLLSEAYGWSYSDKYMRFIKCGDNQYRIGAWTKQHGGTPGSNGAGYKIAPGYAFAFKSSGDEAFYSHVYGQSSINSNYYGSLVLAGGYNCHSGWDSDARVQVYTINMSTLAWTTEDKGDGGSYNYPSVDLITGSNNYTMSAAGGHNWKLSSFSVTAGSHTYYISQHDKTYTEKTWEAQQDGKAITNATPYATLSTSDKDDEAFNLTAGTYTVYYNDVTKDIWFVKQ